MKIKHFLLLAVAMCCASCFKDNTTLGNGEIAVITIDSVSINEYYDIKKNEVLTITPVIKQSFQDKALTYTWEVDQKVYSNDAALNYKGDKLGVFQCRLVVENEDGKAFYAFKISVNSPYEEGYTLLSCDDNGNSMLSFMLTQYDAGVEPYFEKGDCFTINNPDEVFASGASDIVQCNKNVIISCKGKDEDSGVIYYLNDKTFVLENKLEAPEYPDFKPVNMVIPGNGLVGNSYPIICENGKVYEFSVTEGAIVQAEKFRYTYSPRTAVYTDISPNYYSLFIWDKEVGGLSMLYNGYGPFYCGPDYLLERDNCKGAKNYFDGYNFVTMFMPRVPENAKEEQQTLVVITTNGAMWQKVILNGVFFWDMTDEGKYIVVDNGGKKMAGFSDPHITAETPLVSSRLYYALFFGDGNKVRRWNYYTSQMLEQSTTHCVVGTENAVVTSMELSRDQEELFVAFYEPDENGLNGHVWVYGTDSGELLRKYDNVSYRPVKIFYKKK